MVSFYYLLYLVLRAHTNLRTLTTSLSRTCVFSTEWLKLCTYNLGGMRWISFPRFSSWCLSYYRVIVCPRWEDCLHEILVWKFSHERVLTYSHEILHITEGTNKVWHANKTKASLWWYMDFRFEWFPRGSTTLNYSTESAFLWAIDWHRFRYDITNDGKVIPLIFTVFSTWTHYSTRGIHLVSVKKWIGIKESNTSAVERTLSKITRTVWSHQVFHEQAAKQVRGALPGGKPPETTIRG